MFSKEISWLPVNLLENKTKNPCSFATRMLFHIKMHVIDARGTCGFWRKSAMSIVQDGHFITFFCALNVRLPWPLCLVRLWPAKAPSRHALQKLWAHGVVIGLAITFRQIWQLNSALWTTRSKRNFHESIDISHDHGQNAFHRNCIFRRVDIEGFKLKLIKYHTFQKFFSNRYICFLSLDYPNHFAIFWTYTISNSLFTGWRWLFPHPATFFILRSKC